MHTISELTIESGRSITKIDQIVLNIKREIETGKLKTDERLPSISYFSKQHKVAKETVERAYRELQRLGYIFPVSGKGNYVSSITSSAKKVLIIVEALNHYNQKIYSAFSKKLGGNVKVDLQLHHNDPFLLKEIAFSSQGKYHFYVVMPPCANAMKEYDMESALRPIPVSQVIILNGKPLQENSKYINIYQDFKKDTLEALSSRSELFNRYQSITLLSSAGVSYLTEVWEGIKCFGDKYSKKVSLKSSQEDIEFDRGGVYMVLTESDLATLARKLSKSDLKIGEDVGLLSFHDSVLNELLDVTAITSNFEAMCETAARLILEKHACAVRNSYSLIQRKSL